MKAKLLSLSFILVIVWGSLPLNAQITVDPREYLFPEFSQGIIKRKNGSTLNRILNYNIITRKMDFIEGNKLLTIANEELIDTVILNERKFVPYNETFCEVLVKASCSLLLQHKADLVPIGSPAGYGSTSQTSAIDSYVGTDISINRKNMGQYEIKPSPVYWIVSNTFSASFNNRNQFMKVFPHERTELQNFIKKNRIDFENPQDIEKVIKYYNEIKRE